MRVPERPNGSVLKTDDRRKAVRGFKSHPRRSSPIALSLLTRKWAYYALTRKPARGAGSPA
jgi:hypothetical protein